MERDDGVLDERYATSRKTKPALQFRLSARAQVVADAVSRYASANAGLRILDMGAAEGRTLLTLDRLVPGNRLIGVEYSGELISSAPALPENVRLVEGDVTALPESLRAESFDVVSALAVLEHLNHPDQALREAWRMLRPGGLFVATSPVPFWDSLSGRLGLLKGDQHRTEMTRKTMIRFVQNAGFDLVQYRRFMWAPVSFLPYLRVPLSARLAAGLDRWIGAVRVLDWLFVNQVVIGQKPGV